MKNLIEALQAHPQAEEYKINIHKKESCELFYVMGKLETVRRTDTCDTEVTVYVRHGAYKGDAKFFVYPSTTPQQLAQAIDEAAAKALLINNESYELPAGDGTAEEYKVESNFDTYDPAQLAGAAAKAVFGAEAPEGTTLNAVEIFINRHTETVLNSRGLHRTQVRYDAMVEAIPTCSGEAQSVELYEQLRFSSFDAAQLSSRIAAKMAEVKARYSAAAPAAPLAGSVVLGAQELSELFWCIAEDADYAAAYGQTGVFKKGDAVQKEPIGDTLGITMAGAVPGSPRSAVFDADGLLLGSIRLVEGGRLVNYYGSNRYGQYLGEVPTGVLGCICVDAGSVNAADPAQGPWLEVLSMSGLQVDFYTDYIGGEVRLALWHDGETVTPVTGISIAGSLSEVLSGIRLSVQTTVQGGYCGPEKAVLNGMKIF